MLEKLYFHHCKTPKVTDLHADHRWTCEKCGSAWSYYGGFARTRTVRSGPLWNRKAEEVTFPSFWMCSNRVKKWSSEPIEGWTTSRIPGEDPRIVE